MARHKPEDDPRRIAVVRALPGLGDFLAAVPAFRALRAAYPAARIDVIGLPSTLGLMQRFSHYVDRLMEFPGFPGIPEVPLDVTRLWDFLTKIRREDYDLAIQMHGDGEHINAFTFALGAGETIGYHPPEQTSPDSARFLAYPREEPEVRRNLRLIRSLGVPAAGEELEFPLTPLDSAELGAIPDAASLAAGSYIIVHPGASDDGRSWDADNFALVGDRLAAGGLTVVLTGTGEEAPLASAVAAEMRYPALNLAGRTSLGALAALVSGTALLVANDTGVSSLAQAFSVPSIVVFSAADPVRWAPIDSSTHRVIQDHRPLAPRLLSSEATFFGDRMGEVELEPEELPLDQVMAEVEDLLAIGGTDVI